MNTSRMTFLALLSLPLGVSGCALLVPEETDYYADWAPPQVGALTPASENGNVGGGLVTIIGGGFGTDASQLVVQFGDESAEIVSVTDGEITVRVPTGPITGGRVAVRVGTPSGYADADGGYTYAIDDLYTNQVGFVQVNNYWESCLGGLSGRDYRDDAGCDTFAYIGTTGIDGQASALSFAWPRFHTENVGFFGGTDESVGQWTFERPGATSFVFGVDELRKDIGDVTLTSAFHDGEDTVCVDLDGTATYRFGGGIEGFEAPLTVQDAAIPEQESTTSTCDEGTVAYAPDVLRFCPTQDVEGVSDLVYRTDWPVAQNFFAGARRDLKPADLRLNAPEVGIENVPVTVPESLVVYAEQGFDPVFGADTPEDYDGSMWGVGSLQGCYDDDGNGEKLDDVAIRFSWDPTGLDLEAVQSSSGGRITGIRSYVRVTITALSLNWFGTSGYPVRATLVVPDRYNFDRTTQRSTLEIPASVLYQFPTVKSPPNGGQFSALIDSAQSDWGYLLVTADRVTDYAVASNAGGDVVFSYATGDFGFFDWTNPVDADACHDCEDGDGDGWTDAEDPDCFAGGTEETSVTTGSACNDGIDNDGDGDADADDVDCIGGGDDDEASDACHDGLDDDGDGWIDAADPDCAGAGTRERGYGTAACNDGEDNDGDGVTDSADLDCTGPTDADEAAPLPGSCEDGTDDDLDGWTDLDDPDCLTGDAEVGPGTSACNDGLDNEGDGATDAMDADCADAFGESEGEPGPAGCENGTDDDGDGWTDASDPDCTEPSSAEAGFGTGTCNDGVDNDGDTFSDSADSDCASASATEDVP